LPSISQNNIRITISNTSYAATDSLLTFWFISNQNGKIKPEGSFLNITELEIGKYYKTDSAQKKLDYSWGSNFVGGLGETNYLQINSVFLALSYQGWEIKGGRFYDEIKYSGLSTTNGNLARSQNSIPVPKIRFSTLGYKNLPFFKNWFRFKAEYDEGFLTDSRYVDGAHLHHKSLYGEFSISQSWKIYLGFEHYVMWGGTSRNEKIGKLPDDWCSYWRYVFALPGNDKFLETDKKNVSGNQLGTYQFEVVKDFEKLKSTFYLSHPWEDNSGLNWRNWRDNLLGFHINFKNENKIVTDILYEFTNTRNQSLKDSLYNWDEETGKWRRNEVDNYYNHGIYRSGFTYQQQVMSSPLFFPVTITDGISMGIRSNRFVSHHLGIAGNLSSFFFWKGLITFSRHSGTYGKPYEPAQNQISGLIDFMYINPEFPLDLGFSIAADDNSVLGKNLGFRFSISKNW